MKNLQSNFFLMNNTIQNYAWGSTDSMTALFDTANPQQEPQAEMWMGDHPNGCSKICSGEHEILLSDFIASDIDAVLGRSAAFKAMPFLFKVLAAEKALSVQVHPNKQQAETGFALEEKSGIAQDASNRNYRDANHKPELVFALTKYQAMNGFRDLQTIADDFDRLDISSLNEALNHFKADFCEQGLARFFSAVLSLHSEQKDQAIEHLLHYAAQQSATRFELIMQLKEQYPGDIGLFSPLFLHTVTLQPGQAMFLDAGTPHAYIHGTALEIMANSDNVLRAGLTPKYIDVAELIDKTRFNALKYEQLCLEPVREQNSEHYLVPVDDFRFSVYKQPQKQQLQVDTAEILFAVDAEASLVHSSGEEIIFNKGQAVFIPAYAQEYSISTKGTLARAYC
ncbi:mannose-6-phosphate isomerase, class I [Psychromonas aquimarina]|uniref:mannose-6-phosphate isomerase, class I n=1 Tax=Psychromonas aquimarina TaxID=444919 RepID=UPI0004128650|nr:mannose-6-phosphate isomerase, class I [Psychromonas aquimarina]